MHLMLARVVRPTAYHSIQQTASTHAKNTNNTGQGQALPDNVNKTVIHPDGCLLLALHLVIEF